ncbi:MAG TPA: hypothetical protein VGS97_23235 [Actinocrinis sp.]|uniref:hypothetical protein n=1 Tax=Actinocrinis sp. TaxID=1920516 RepID=UPI002DDDA587|nr:hypothetical protein [Actinocrinis sp.]HEV2347035.1 hypothetical protein [Actinocrinis sp.]
MTGSTARFTHLAAPEVTAHLTGSVARWAEQYGYWVQREVPPPGVADRRLDLRVAHPAEGRAISIEIDRGNKRWSLEKVVAVAEHGDLALWVRWPTASVPLSVPPGVRLIRLGVIRYRRRVSLQPGCCQLVGHGAAAGDASRT